MERTIVIAGTLIDGTGKSPIPDAVIQIAGERIVNVSRKGDLPIPGGANVIDASDKTVLPGLIDSHVHLGPLADNSMVKVAEPMALVELYARELLRHGVTTVRETGDLDPENVFPILKHGREDWPRWFGATVIIEGPGNPPAPWPWCVVVDDEASARAKVREFVEAGADFLKVYIWLRPAVLAAVVEEAHALGVPVAAHVGHVTTVEEAVQIGVDALEHIRIGKELLSEEEQSALDALPPRKFDPIVSWRPWRFIDPESERAERLMDLMAERNVFLTPTLTLSQSILMGDKPEVVEAPTLGVMPTEVVDQWRDLAYCTDYSEHDFDEAKVELARQMEFVGRAHERGVKILAGTDTQNPFIVPGFSLHDELRLLVDCDLSPLQAITAATGRPAELLNQQQNVGTVQKGRFADLLIVRGNPLKDIEATQQVWAVLKSGKILVGSDS